MVKKVDKKQNKHIQSRLNKKNKNKVKITSLYKNESNNKEKTNKKDIKKVTKSSLNTTSNDKSCDFSKEKTKETNDTISKTNISTPQNKTRNSNPPSNKDTREIFIRNLDFQTTEQKLRSLFLQFIPEESIEFCLICKDKTTGVSKGSAFLKLDGRSYDKIMTLYRDY